MYKSKRPYFYGTGRRKSSVARVHLFEGGTGSITINGRSIDDYFGLETLKMVVRQPLNTVGLVDRVDIEATVSGGGVSGQAGALRHGIARALLEVNPDYRAALKAAGFLTRDPRM
ncbi:MAG: 30S ribosomal protein S9, partial [Oscillospiraceae bacterium]|nr:30S ribosomal protein S9 [Oscillospiraceae bacterium]